MENFHSQSSQLAEPLWIDHGLKSGSGVQDLISTAVLGAGISSVGRVSGWRAAEAGLSPRCGKGFLFQSQL